MTYQVQKAKILHIEGNFIGNTDTKIAIAIGRFNGFVVEALVDGAIDALVRHGVLGENITTVRVAGAFELPLVVQRLAKSQRFDAVIVLGAVIRGSTPHFDVVANESAKGISQIALQCNLPIINGILTTDTIEQAIERAGTKAGNKGYDAGITALEMISVLEMID